MLREQDSGGQPSRAGTDDDRIIRTFDQCRRARLASYEAAPSMAFLDCICYQGAGLETS
jgi:hypothetical protein